MRVSIVIPVYNEESHLSACLDAIAQQTVAPFEVIVVDNNSTDGTAAIAGSYPFVTVLSEARQGVVHARNAGFDAAKGDIVGRIDADTIIAPDWVATAGRIFANKDVDVVSGALAFYDIPFKAFFDRVDNICRNYLARSLGKRRELFLYGGNMAIRRTVWHEVRGTFCNERSFHEDIDMAAHFAHGTYNLAYSNDLCAAISARRVDSGFASYWSYVWANSRTYAAHGLRSRVHMYPIELAAIACYLPLRVLYRMYDTQTRRLSLRKLYQSRPQERVSPLAETL